MLIKLNFDLKKSKAASDIPDVLIDMLLNLTTYYR